MNKENLERYKDRIVTIGVPHFEYPNKLFFHTGLLLSLESDTITIKKESEELLFLYTDIKFLKALGSSEPHNE